MLLLLLVILLVTLAYWKFVVKPHSVWKKKGVKHAKPTPIVGDYYGLFTRKESLVDMIERLYNSFREERYVGAYQMLMPTLLVRDPDLIRQIAIKDFDHFSDHMQSTFEGFDPFWSKNLFSTGGERWHRLRSTLSPAFTSSKMKSMFVLISEAGERFATHFARSGSERQTVELKDVFTRYANDVIATCSFGVTCNSLTERNNEFYLMGKEATNVGFVKATQLMLTMLAPKLANLLSVKFYSTKVANFFLSLITDAVNTREKNNIYRPDMIHLLMEARNGRLRHDDVPQLYETGFATVEESHVGRKVALEPQEMSMVDMTAQALIFFFAGFDTSSMLMCFMGYELGIKPEVQERLQREVDNVMKECNGKPTYEAVAKMKYLDMVVSETLRRWPPPTMNERICTKPYTIQPVRPGESPVTIEKGVDVWFAVWGLHHDPEYFPEPYKFDPERFSDDNKDKIKPYTYLPFGVGPRNCIGSRFALLEVKTVYVHLLSKFEIVPNERTEVPLRLLRSGFSVGAENGFWFDLKKRSDI